MRQHGSIYRSYHTKIESWLYSALLFGGGHESPLYPKWYTLLSETVHCVVEACAAPCSYTIKILRYSSLVPVEPHLDNLQSDISFRAPVMICWNGAAAASARPNVRMCASNRTDVETHSRWSWIFPLAIWDTHLSLELDSVYSRWLR